MRPSDVNRRDFSRLALAALGGLLAGTSAGYGDEKEEEKKEDKKTSKKHLLLLEPHICRGLNTCKGKGKGGKHDCAGMGNCHTVESHTCKGENECRGQGGCGEKPGENACKGMGECAVPLKDKVWTKARKRFEELMTKEGKKFGPAPAKKS
jgi:hypothetical protein